MSHTQTFHAPRITDAGDALGRFLAYAALMLDPATPEPKRCQLEPRLLALLPVLRALGVFDLLSVRHPALRALIEDELALKSA
ncbi:hypothetical protein [Oleiagrimonas sp. C23AA]|uniref:hypothetical protein n=1 Tax=Oleiagrimonas sp. C23AA TaxID=2719047 RepID=UPI00141E1EFC|nr:hypothetical protein [Oleiagrimonas sp. C23AA]NII11322.1 hypothetical protein [Oleiagrimonas sp. C23AA]